LPNIVFSHLDSDLPFYLWWQGELRDPMDPQLWAWVDRFVYDSREWQDFSAQMQRVETAQREARQRIVLCDLNWTRLDKVRLAVAQFFDHPAAHHHFAEIESFEIDFAPGYRSTALLLAGWLGAQLSWKVETNGRRKEGLQFLDPKGRKIEMALRERAGEPIGQIVLKSGNMEFGVLHPQGADLLQVSRGKPAEDRAYQLMPAGGRDLVQLMSDELIRGGPHRVYLHAITCIRELL
jgi:glucose-6-phosphate dehydrogenase assembly protein OpcA